jgi:hypothetical protein
MARPQTETGDGAFDDVLGVRELMARTAIVAGYLVGYPAGGHVMSILHWFAGLRSLGYDVVFVEHHGWRDACFNPRTNTMSDDPSYGIEHLAGYAQLFGLRAWCFVDRQGRYHGISQEEMVRLCKEADVLLGIWTVTWLDEFHECRRRIFIDTDPGFTQFTMPPGARASLAFASPVDFHEHYSVGTRIGQPDCPIPTHGITWRPTRFPVALDLLPFHFAPDAECFTTVMAWAPRKPVVYEGVEYGLKEIEFWRIAELPTRVNGCMEIALGGNAPFDRIAAAGWRITDALAVSVTPWTYRDYLARSRGEFSVLTNLYVKTRSGAFSDRTAAYLATGKPAVVQDTGFSEELPCGEGLFAFSTLDEAVAAIEEINRDYRRHCRAARRIAEQHFDARRVIGRILGGDQ